MGVPAVPLGDLYASAETAGAGRLEVRLRSPVGRICLDGEAVGGVEVAGGRRQADYYVSALPFDQLAAVAPELGLDVSAFRYSPITGIHLWFDRPITDLPHAALLGRTIQWLFNKAGGRYVQLVVSASDSLVAMSRGRIIELALRELAEFFPGVSQAGLEKAHVIKELRATFSPAPGLETARPATRTAFANLFLAGDWTRTGWPSTMEGAVRSGYLAAEAVARAAGEPHGFLVDDVA
jgi:zeta-carotene desaturase